MKSVGSAKRACSGVWVVLSIVAGGIGFCSFAQPILAQSSLEARVQRLEDEEAIRNLLVEYGRDLDTGNLVAYSNLFAKDGTFSGLLGSAKGPEAIFQFVQKLMAKAKPYDPKHLRSFYLMTNFYIHVDGERATATSKWIYWGRSEDNKLVPRLSGHYDDVFVRENGQWKFFSRASPRDIP